MEPLQRKVLQQNWTFLIQNISTDESLLVDHLYEMNTVTINEMEVVRTQSPMRNKVVKLLEILQRKSPEAFHQFIEALERSNQSHIAHRLNESLEEELRR
uniref:Caspase n=1 Tax=Pomacea canaliculata TaxID=400727 RepID=A0A1W5T6T4_POMCA|nr:caspase [Pomacea canaliculata]